MIAIQDIERALAVSYAPAGRQAGLRALFALDERLGGIVSAAREPTIGLMRLVWWRDALGALDAVPAPAEPLLRTLAEEVLPRGVAGASLAEQEDGWAALLDGPIDGEALARHARARGGGLFGAAAALLGATDGRLAQLGEGWALADLAHRSSDPALRQAAAAQGQGLLAAVPRGGWSRAARPLAALGVLAVRDVADRGPRRQGAPGRVARMLALRLTGR